MTIIRHQSTCHAELVSASSSIDNENADNLIPASVGQNPAGACDMRKNKCL